MEETPRPRVTALIVSRNDAADLPACLEALEQSEDRERLEILVVDDGSQDGSAEVPSDYPNVITLRLPKRFGWTRAVNIGLRTAKGENILFLPARARVAPDAVRRMADALDEDNSIGAVIPRVERVWRTPTADQLAAAVRVGELPGAEPGPANQAAVEYPHGAPVLVRRELLRAMNYLDQRFGAAWADLEMYSRIRGGGKRVVVRPDVDVTCPPASPEERDGVEVVDSAHGAATWVGLHEGFASALKVRISLFPKVLSAAGPGAALGFLAGGGKIDGNQE